MASMALINKGTLALVREKKAVTLAYMAENTKFAEERIKSWESSTLRDLPTLLQAKKLAKCLRVPFAGLYMNPDDVKVKNCPKSEICVRFMAAKPLTIAHSTWLLLIY